MSYLRERLRPMRAQTNFEDVITHMFGRRLYRIFFKEYTEKVWGMSCREISADWARQRVKGLSIRSALTNALWLGRRPKPPAGDVKTLILVFGIPDWGRGCCGRSVRGGSVIWADRSVWAGGWSVFGWKRPSGRSATRAPAEMKKSRAPTR